MHTTNATTSGAAFDMLGTGTKVPTGWASAGEGFLVLPSSDGTVSSAQNFVPFFSALAQFDLNHDGVINSGDPIWSQLRVWVNTASDGVFRATNLHSLSDLGITSINLGAATDPRYDNGNIIMEDGSFTCANGTMGNVAQAALLNGDAAAAATITADANSLTVGGGAGMATQYIVGGAGGGNTIYVEGDSSAFAAGTGGVALTVDGNGNSVSTVAQSTGGAVAVINGDNNTLTAGALSRVTEAGSGNAVVAGAGANITVTGNNNTAVVGTTAYAVEEGSGNAVNAGAGSTVTVIGGDNTAVAGTTAYVIEGGSSNAIDAGAG